MSTACCEVCRRRYPLKPAAGEHEYLCPRCLAKRDAMEKRQDDDMATRGRVAVAPRVTLWGDAREKQADDGGVPF